MLIRGVCLLFFVNLVTDYGFEAYYCIKCRPYCIKRKKINIFYENRWSKIAIRS